MKPIMTVARQSQTKEFQDRLKTLTKKAVYVGIPASSARDRQQSLLKMAGKISDTQTRTVKGKKKVYPASKPSRTLKSYLQKAAEQDLNNAQLLYIFSKGSPIRNQPARPVLEPAIEAPGNKEAIAAELAAASKAALDGKPGEATARLKRAGVAGQNAARGWFTDSRNGWAQNARSTIRKKLGKLSGKRLRGAIDILDSVQGFMPNVGANAALDSINTPGIDTGAMRQAIVWTMEHGE